MKKWNILKALLIIVICAAPAARAAQGKKAPKSVIAQSPAVQEKKGPKIVVEQPLWDFGKISQGDKVSHLYKIENHGDQDLIVSRVQPTCGCTIAEISTNTVRPGEYTTTEVTFDSKFYRDMIEKEVYVISNDSSNPSLRLTIFGSVESAFIESDIGIRTKPFVPGVTPTDERLIIRNAGRQEFKVTNIRSTSSRYKVLIASDTVVPGDYSFASIEIKPEKKKSTNKKAPDYIYFEIGVPIE